MKYFKNEVETGYKIKYIIRNISIKLNDIIKNIEMQKGDFSEFKSNIQNYVDLIKDDR